MLELTVALARQIKGVLPSSKAILHVGAINAPINVNPVGGECGQGVGI